MRRLPRLDASTTQSTCSLLAREQRLTVSSDSSSVEDLRAAIVTAAERRIANRFAAAG